MVPAVWYIGYVPTVRSPDWYRIPYPSAGNTITPHQYQQHWLDIYQTQPAACTAGSVAPIDGEWSLPGPRELLDANPNAINQPHAEYPAWDWIIPTGTPIYAIHPGTITTTRTWPHNWWDKDCGTNGGSDCDTCGIGLTITDHAGVRWTYCHGTQTLATAGDTVKAGQQIMTSGNTGRSGTPHVHIEIRTPDNVQHCPQPLVASLYRDSRSIDPASLPTTGCSY